MCKVTGRCPKVGDGHVAVVWGSMLLLRFEGVEV